MPSTEFNMWDLYYEFTTASAKWCKELECSCGRGRAQVLSGKDCLRCVGFHDFTWTCLHAGGVWVASPEVLLYKPNGSRWSSTLCCLACWNLWLCQAYKLGLSFRLEASPEAALLSKCSISLWFWLWSQGSPGDSVAMLLVWIFQDQVFKGCVTIVNAKKLFLELTAGLQMGSHNGACIRPQAFIDNQGQCCIWPRALKSNLLKCSPSPTPASEPLCHQVHTETHIFLTGSLCSGIALTVLSSN